MEDEKITIESIIRKIVREELSVAVEQLTKEFIVNSKSSFSDYPAVLTTKDISEILNISKSRVYELVRTNTFPKIVIGKSIRIPKDQFLVWMHRQNVD